MFCHSKKRLRLLVAMLCIALAPVYAQKANQVDIKSVLKLAEKKAILTFKTNADTNAFPRNICGDAKVWKTSRVTDWTTGFWPGMLWYLYDFNKKPKFREMAEYWSRPILKNKDIKWTHDLGFMLHSPLYTAISLLPNPTYQAALIDAANSLTGLYNPKIGTMKSWTWLKQHPHPTIADNMMNLEILFWAAKKTGNQTYKQIAIQHALTTIAEHIRPDGSSYHVVAYDTATAKPYKKYADQGMADNSTWSRGQAWLIYGFAVAYRETMDERFLQTAQKTADWFIEHLPPDVVPYWDFDAPQTAETPKDASAAAIAAAGLLKLSTYCSNVPLKKKYYDNALRLLRALSAPPYLDSDPKFPALLRRSTGSKPHNSEVDCSIIYADYYYIEAMLWLYKQGIKKI